VLEAAGVVRVELAPLSLGAVSALLAARLAGPLPRRVIRQVFEASGGNPLFALELGRAVAERGVPDIGAALPVPAVLAELFGARVGALPPLVRRALLAVALSAGLTAAELAAVTDPLAVQDAAAAGVLVADGGRVRAARPAPGSGGGGGRPGAGCPAPGAGRGRARCRAGRGGGGRGGHCGGAGGGRRCRRAGRAGAAADRGRQRRL
jgi:hypothetical protein